MHICKYKCDQMQVIYIQARNNLLEHSHRYANQWFYIRLVSARFVMHISTETAATQGAHNQSRLFWNAWWPVIVDCLNILDIEQIFDCLLNVNLVKHPSLIAFIW